MLPSLRDKYHSLDPSKAATSARKVCAFLASVIFSKKMNSAVLRAFVLAAAVMVVGVLARPSSHRVKRVSDAHLADLETRIALNNKLKGIAITMPVGGGKIDPFKIGRRRRSQKRLLDVLFNNSEEQDQGDPVDGDYVDLFTY